jgi:hypothetical protein
LPLPTPPSPSRATLYLGSTDPNPPNYTEERSITSCYYYLYLFRFNYTDNLLDSLKDAACQNVLNVTLGGRSSLLVLTFGSRALHTLLLVGGATVCVCVPGVKGDGVVLRVALHLPFLLEGKPQSGSLSKRFDTLR